jgi:hypothetical protein
MESMHFYSNAKSKKAKYGTFADALLSVDHERGLNERNRNDIYDIAKVKTERNNISGELQEKYFINIDTENENLFNHLCAYNKYLLDYHGTNTCKFFEDEIKNAGFIINYDMAKEPNVNMCPELKKNMNSMVNEVKQECFEMLSTLVVSDEVDENSNTKCVDGMMKRAQILKLSTVEDISEYRRFIEDEETFEHFLNFNRLMKKYDDVEQNYIRTQDDKFLSVVHHNIWVKIMRIHQLAKFLGIKNDVLAFEKIVIPDKEVIQEDKTVELINDIKRLYNKRDKVTATEYDGQYLFKLYKFMIENQTKKLGFLESKRKKSRVTGDNYIFSITAEVYEKCLTLVAKMNAPVYIVTMEENEGLEDEDVEEEEDDDDEEEVVEGWGDKVEEEEVEEEDEDEDEEDNSIMDENEGIEEEKPKKKPKTLINKNVLTPKKDEIKNLMQFLM